MEIKIPKFKVIFKGLIREDCCSRDVYQLEEPMTVKEMCEYILSTNEWGYIGINCPGTIFGKPYIEYCEHQYVDENRQPIKMNWPESILNAQIKQVIWDGGWSRGDWLFTI